MVKRTHLFLGLLITSLVIISFLLGRRSAGLGSLGQPTEPIQARPLPLEGPADGHIQNSNAPNHRRNDDQSATIGLADFPDLSDREKAIVLRRYASDDPEGSVAWVLATTTGRDQGRYLKIVFEVIVDSNLEFSKDLFSRLTPGDTKTGIVPIISRKIINDIEGALDWISSLLPDERSAAIPQIIAKIASFPEDEIRSYAASGKLDENEQKSLGSLYSDRLLNSGNDFVSSIGKITSSFSDGLLRDSAIESLIHAQALRDPDIVAGWIDNTGDHVSPLVLEELGLFWAKKNPRDAAMWVQRNKTLSKFEKGRFARGLVFEWLQMDSIAASSWVKELPKGDERSEAAGAIARFLASKGDLADATRWIDEVEDAEERSELRQIIERANQ